MNKNELYEKLVTMVPVKSDGKKDFRIVMREQLKMFRMHLNNLDDKEQPIEWESIIIRTKQLCEAIIRAIDNEYKGIRHSAYSAIKNQLDGYKTRMVEIDGLAYRDNLLTISECTESYRMRKVQLEEQRKLKAKDMFHIPLDKRGLVETQRFSVPGYPCLYLAHNVYGCWEEMGRPDFGTVMVSRFVSQKKFKVLDLRIPSKAKWNTNMKECIPFFPLIIASMVQVKNNKDTYKPEYLIPQLLIEWVISHNRDKNDPDDEILGIKYTSAHKNDDFNFPDTSYDNYAIPVLTPLKSKKYCSRLEEIFHLTTPTYYDLEVLRNGEPANYGALGLDEEQQKKHNLEYSRFGTMEEFLREKPLETINE